VTRWTRAIDLIQVRERDLETASSSTCGELVGLPGSTTRIIVNDRVDVALACGAGGVHLRSDSIAPAAARSMVTAPVPLMRGVRRRPSPHDT
jgi:thiamine-phosphate pyrophosphorylase